MLGESIHRCSGDKSMQHIFIHGLGQTPFSWEKTMDNMTVQSDKATPDLFAMLKKRDSNYTNLYSAFSEFCDEFAGLLDICGISLGGVLALQYGIEHPQRVHSLVLIGTQYKVPKMLLAFQNLIFRCMPQSMFEQIGLGKSQFIELSRSMTELNYSDSLQKISCPVLVLCGEKDKANMKASKELAELCHGKFVMIENAGHEVNVDKPEELARVLDEFYK